MNSRGLKPRQCSFAVKQKPGLVSFVVITKHRKSHIWYKIDVTANTDKIHIVNRQ